MGDGPDFDDQSGAAVLRATMSAVRGNGGDSDSLEGRHSSSPAATTPAGATVSVIIPTFDRLPQLRRAIDAVMAQTYASERFEVVVVSDGSTDGTDEYLQEQCAPNLVYASQRNAGPAAARNRGIELATGDLLLFIDDDVVASPQLVERHAEHHRLGGDRLVVIGPMATPMGTYLSPWVQWEQEMLYRQYDAMRRGLYGATARQFYTGNASVARAHVVAAGGFDTRFRRAEDIELAYRLDEAGLRFTFEPDAVGYHYADRSFASWLKIAYDYGATDVLLAREGHRSVGQIVRDGFQRRTPLTRRMIRACIERPWLGSLAQHSFMRTYAACNTVHADRLRRYALSGLYNTSYYRGVADELGGAHAFSEALVGSNGGSLLTASGTS